MGANLKRKSTKRSYHSARLSHSYKCRQRYIKKRREEDKQIKEGDEVDLLVKCNDEERALVLLDCAEIIIENSNSEGNVYFPLSTVDFSNIKPCSKKIKRNHAITITSDHLKEHDYDSSSIVTEIENVYNDNCKMSEMIDKPTTTGSCNFTISNIDTDGSKINQTLNDKYFNCDQETLNINNEKQLNNLINEIHVADNDDDIDETRYVVDMDFFMKEMHKSFDDHALKNGCLFRDWIWLKRKTRQHGLLTQFSFHCQNCNYETCIWSEPINDNRHMEINKAAVISSVAAGIGHSQFEKLFSGINIHSMSDKTYINIKNDVFNNVETISFDIMEEAAEEEKRVAIEKGNVTEDGTPFIAVTVDGSWMKRSYGTNYNSPSGVGAIVGYHTGKILFYGVRNKYCLVCERAENKGMKPSKHKCFKNWDSKIPSTGMESDAILEGFRRSIEMYGLIYKTIVTDGDSSIYKAIVDNNIYTEYNIVPQRILCTNHLLRNLCKKLRVVSKTTQPRGEKRVVDFVELRTLVKSKIGKVREGVEQSVSRRVAENTTWSEKVNALREDILNVPMHIFGQHSECTKFGFDCKPECEGHRNYIPDLQRVGLYSKIEEAIQFLSVYSESLLHRMTNNAVESFNSIICVEIGGKRINWGLRNQYNIRVGMSVIQHNTQQILTEMFRRTGKKLPHVAVSVEKRRQEKVLRNRNDRRSRGRRKMKRLYKHGGKQFYGTTCGKPDRSQKEMDNVREKLFQKLKANQQNKNVIERETVLQRHCSQWQTMHKNILTASNFGLACRWQPHTSCAAKVKKILYPATKQIESNPAVLYGKDQERIALAKLAKELALEVKTCGLFIDSTFEYLGASPDALVGEDGIIEIKSPFTAANMTAEDAIKNVKSIREAFDKNDLNKMNTNHDHFYQIQGQLHISNKQYCLYVINTPYSMKSIRIEKDDEFWNDKMEKQLIRFYMDCMLPEILDSRHNRHMAIRDPEYTLKAKEELRKKKMAKRIIGEKSCKNTLPNTEVDGENNCEITGVYQKNLTEEDFIRLRLFFDERELDVSKLETQILDVTEYMNDNCIDIFTRVVKIYEVPYEIQSVLYIIQLGSIRPAKGPSIQILGGLQTQHWRTVYYNGTHLYVYDSLPEFGPLRRVERDYVRARYPDVTDAQIVYKQMRTRQPDFKSCGIYACAFLLSIVFGEDPSVIQFSLDVRKMREHFVRIIKNEELLHFPTIND